MTVATDAGAVARTPAQVAQDTILVLDFGSQYSQLIARRVREAKVYCELVPGHDQRRRDPAPQPARHRSSAADRRRCSMRARRTRIPPLYDLDIPILGICYGMDLLAVDLGGAVAPAERREYGHASVTVDEPHGPLREASGGARGVDVARRRRHRACRRGSGRSPTR